MVIEHAERFGLAQMHQLRGRVGRGAAKSFCVLLTGSKVSPEAEQRLDAMVRTQNGFELAELDLQQRGPGEFFGTRQAGSAGVSRGQSGARPRVAGAGEGGGCTVCGGAGSDHGAGGDRCCVGAAEAAVAAAVWAGRGVGSTGPPPPPPHLLPGAKCFRMLGPKDGGVRKRLIPG